MTGQTITQITGTPEDVAKAMMEFMQAQEVKTKPSIQWPDDLELTRPQVSLILGNHYGESKKTQPRSKYVSSLKTLETKHTTWGHLKMFIENTLELI